MDCYGCDISDQASRVSIYSDLPSWSTVVENTKVSFTCKTERNPPAQLSLILWPSFEVLASEVANSIYTTIKLSRKDNGFAFKCMVSNHHDSSEVLSEESYQYTVTCELSWLPILTNRAKAIVIALCCFQSLNIISASSPQTWFPIISGCKIPCVSPVISLFNFSFP